MPAAADYLVQPHDRIEIYRPLLIDPKQARLRRAAKKRQAYTGNRGT
jgi:putative ubiquitin-RnfH superfamily antitoxin RatB of RatAB toxin-antitoxin module